MNIPGRDELDPASLTALLRSGRSTGCAIRQRRDHRRAGLSDHCTAVVLLKT